VNYVYGTWQALVGLIGAGVKKEDPAVLAGANWLLCCQQPCGGWGESADSYADPRLRGQGPPTASQTAWAVMGLVAAGFQRHPAVLRGIQYLIERQNGDGTWDEPEFTGTGFPQVFYLRYHYYRIYFPLMAMSRWRASITTHRIS
jgi:squalene-hopene/tetraprenyl-beta-curcumene cyclase